MISIFTYAAGFAAVFFLPGFCFCCICGIRRLKFLLSVGFSYALAVATLLVCQALETTLQMFILALALEINVLLLVYLFKSIAARERGLSAGGGSRGRRRWQRVAARRLPLWLGVVAVGGALAAYLVYAGPYTELPSDAWIHLRRIQTQEAMIRGDAGIRFFVAPSELPALIIGKRFVRTAALSKLLLAQSHHWYLLQALLCRLSGLAVADALMPMTACALSVFLLGIYFFGLRIFALFRRSRWTKAAAAALSAVFTAAHLGIFVFAYVRYYAFAPAMVNYVLYLGAAALFLDFVTAPRWSLWPLAGAALLAFTANAVHTQEVLFIFLVCCGMSFVALWRNWLGARAPRAVAARVKSVLAAVAAAGAFAGLFLFFRDRPAFPPDPRFVVPVGQVLPFLRGFFIQPPWGQFYATVGLWGLAVYLLFLFRPSALRKNVFLAAGMAVPLLSVFNPVFVDIMMRYRSVGMEQIYRASYCIPLHFVAGWIAVECLAGVFRRNPLGIRLGNLGIAALLAALLLPFDLRYAVNPVSRLPTLRKTPVKNDWMWWGDMVAELGKRKGATVISDPVTSYLAGGLTPNNVLPGKFDWTAAIPVLASRTPEMEWPAFVETSGIPPGEWLLVVNRRGGGASLHGLASLHWPSDILELGRYYSAEFVAYVESNPAGFRPVWEGDGIRIYEIAEAGGRQP